MLGANGETKRRIGVVEGCTGFENQLNCIYFVARIKVCGCIGDCHVQAHAPQKLPVLASELSESVTFTMHMQRPPSRTSGFNELSK